MTFFNRVVYSSVRLWAFTLLLGTGTLLAQFEKLGESWRWVYFTTETGLPSNRVFAIQETPFGTVWVATQAGLAWFDGYYWHPAGEAQGLPQDRAAIMVPLTGDRIVVLMSGCVYQGGKDGFQLIPLVQDGKSVKVSSLARLSDGKNLVVVDSTIYLLKGEALEPYSISSIISSQKVLDIKTTGDGGLWINTTSGLHRRSGTAWSLVLPASRLPLGIERLVAGVDGRALAYILSPQEMKGMWEIDPQEMPRRLIEEGPDFVQAIDIAPNGDAIMALETGRVRLRRNNSWQSLSADVPQLQSSLAFRFKKNGDLWVGTERGAFLFLASSTRWTHWGHRDLDDRSSINEIIERRDSSIWIARGQGLEIHKRDGSVREIEQINGVDLHPVTGLAEDREGNVWISSGGGFAGAYRWDGKKWQHFGQKEGLGVRLIHKIVVDRQGRPWFLGLSGYDPPTSGGFNGPGAFVYSGGKFVRWGEKEGLQNGRVYAFAEGPQGEYWFGTRTGLSCWRDGQWIYWGCAEGLKSESVFTLAVDNENRLWFGDREFGVGLIEHGVLQYFTTTDGLISNAVWHLAVGVDGRLWVATRGGLSSFFRGMWSSLGPSAGLNHTNLWPVLPLRDELYVGTTGGGTAILHLGEIGKRNPVVVAAPAVVENASVLIRWSAFGYMGEPAHNEIETRYRLDDGQWSPWSLKREVTLPECSPGVHQFILQAKGSLGAFDSSGQNLSFSVLYPFFRQPLYYIPVLAMFIGIVSLTVVSVGRKRRLDKVLALSEAQHRSVVEDQSEFIVRFLPNGTRTFVNSAYCREFGKSTDELVGTSFFESLSGENRERIRRKLAGLTLHSPVATDEHCSVAPSGEICWHQWTDRAIFDNEGRAVEFQAVGQDITERKRAERELKESEEQNRAIVNAVPDLLFRVNSDGTILDYRAPSKSELYVPPEMFLGKNINNVLPPHVSQPAMEAIGRALHSKEMVTFEYELVLHGEQRHYEDRMVPLSANEVLSVIRDTTDRRKAEELLAASERSYKGLFNTVNDAIYLLDSEGKFIDVNDGAVEMYGYPREYFVETPEFLSAPGKNDLAATVEAIQRASTGNPQQFEWWGMRKNGNIFPKDVRLKKGTYFGRDVIIALGLDITLRKEAEELLRQSEERYRSFVETMHDGVLQVDNRDVIQFVNDGFCRMLGYPHDELLGRSALDTFILEADRHIITEKNKLRLGGLADRYEVRAVKKSGGTIWLAVSGAPRYDKKGMVIGSVAVLSDITERRQSQERYRRIVEGTQAILFNTTAQGFFTYANEAACRMLELPLDQLVGRLFARWVHPDDRRRVMATYREQAQVGIQSIATEFRYVSARGKEGWLSFLSNPVIHGDKVVEISGIAQDITERKRAEIALQKSTEKIRAMFETTTDGITFTDLQGKVVEVNEAVVRMHGYNTKEELVGLNAFEFIMESDRGRAMENMYKTAATGRSGVIDYKFVTKSGTIFDADLNSVMLKDNQGQPTGFVAITRDITERRQAEKEQQRLISLIENSNEFVGLASLDGRCTYLNQTGCRMVGLESPDMAKGRSIFEFAPEAIQEQIAGEIIPAVMNTGRWEGEGVLRNFKTGKLIETETSVFIPGFSTTGNQGVLATVMRDITERKRAEEALAEREKRYRALFDLSPTGILLEDALGNILEANEAICKAFNYTREELVGKNVSVLVSPENRSEITEHIGRILSGETLEHEVDNVAKNGIVHRMELRETSIPLADGRTGILSVANDITDRKRIEAILHETNQTLEAFINASPLAIVIVDQAGLIRLWNPAAENILGWKAEEVLENPNPIVPPEKLEEYRALQKRIIDGGETILGLEVTRRRRNGSPIQVSLSTAALHGKDGTVTGVMAILEDITERKRAEEQLRESEARFLHAQRIGHVGNWDWNIQTNELYWSRENYDIYGISPDVRPSLETFMGTVNPADREFVTHAIEDALSGRKPYDIDMAIIRPDGLKGVVHAQAEVQRDETGKPVRMVGTVQDITERKRAEEVLRQRNKFIEIILENAPIGFAVNRTNDGNVQFVSSRFEEIYGVPRGSLKSMESFFNEVYHDPETREQIRSRIISDVASGDQARMIWEDIPITTNDGRTKYVTASNIPLYEQNLMVSTVQDVTARRHAEEQIRASLHEKEVLLKEIHHRVKNNLQVISSLLSLQSNYIQDEASRAIFRESQNRVKSMALIHEKLYQSEDFANIDFALYVRNLTGFLYRSYVIDPNVVEMAVGVQNIQLNIEKAIPCGLIINELVSNSLKHAFPDGRSGRVFVGLSTKDDSTLTLVVGDNGVGLPEHTNLRTTESLGLQLVASLVDQLGATVEVKRLGGTEYGISFPK